MAKKILFLQWIPCIRSYKMAHVLKENGYQVYLGRMFNSLHDFYRLDEDAVYEECFKFSSNSQLAATLEYFDIVHVHNEPDWIVAFCNAYLKGKDVPIIHDCHDYIVEIPHSDDVVGADVDCLNCHDEVPDVN